VRTFYLTIRRPLQPASLQPRSSAPFFRSAL
jgi:hypothetical protein